MGRNRTEAEEAEEEYSPAEMEVYEGDRERAAWERQAALERAAWDPNTTAHQLADLMASGSFASGSSPSTGLSSQSSPGGGANGTAAGAGAGGVDSYVPVVLAYDLGTHGGYARAWEASCCYAALRMALRDGTSAKGAAEESSEVGHTFLRVCHTCACCCAYARDSRALAPSCETRARHPSWRGGFAVNSTHHGSHRAA